MVLAAPPIEVSHCCNVELSPTTAVKTTFKTFSLEDAMRRCGQIVTYAGLLQEQPLAVAPLVGVDVVPAGDSRYWVRHEMELISGPSLCRLPEDERNEAVAGLLTGVAGMATIGTTDKLLTPIDLVPRNCHVDATGKAHVIDVYPPFLRESNGTFVERGLASRRKFREWQLGTMTGVMVMLLQRAADPGNSRDRVAQLFTRTADRCYDLLPAGLRPDVREKIHRHTKSHFLPYLGTLAAVRVSNGVADRLGLNAR